MYNTYFFQAIETASELCGQQDEELGRLQPPSFGGGQSRSVCVASSRTSKGPQANLIRPFFHCRDRHAAGAAPRPAREARVLRRCPPAPANGRRREERATGLLISNARAAFVRTVSVFPSLCSPNRSRFRMGCGHVEICFVDRPRSSPVPCSASIRTPPGKRKRDGKPAPAPASRGSNLPACASLLPPWAAPWPQSHATSPLGPAPSAPVLRKGKGLPATEDASHHPPPFSKRIQPAPFDQRRAIVDDTTAKTSGQQHISTPSTYARHGAPIDDWTTARLA